MVWEARNLGMSKWQMRGWPAMSGSISCSALIPWVGAIPDFFFRSNSRNLRIIKRHLDKHHAGTATIEGEVTSRQGSTHSLSFLDDRQLAQQRVDAVRQLGDEGDLVTRAAKGLDQQQSVDQDRHDQALGIVELSAIPQLGERLLPRALRIRYGFGAANQPTHDSSLQQSATIAHTVWQGSSGGLTIGAARRSSIRLCSLRSPASK